MFKNLFTLLYFLASFAASAQLNPAITSFLQNTTQTGTYYVSGNSTAIPNNILVNCQKVEYTDNHVYIHATGIPAYATGPFQDGNPSQATNQNAIFKIPLSPTKNNGSASPTTPGNIGVFINGVALFDFRDDVAWNPNTNALCGGPGNAPCPGGMGSAQPWNRDAVHAERAGFDCSKAHPAMGNYHHHQNPSAFKLDLDVTSTVCNLYDADGLYAIDSTKHSPLIGYAYDGFPIYGAYGYKNADGTGGITRIKSSYQLRDITVRNTSPTGASVTNGAPINSTYFLGYFREDYAFVAHQGQDDYLDLHNGRICKTPEYPNGIYCYFATVDNQWNSTYPYVVGPTFYGVKANRKVTSVTESTTVYDIVSSSEDQSLEDLDINVFPNPSSDFIAIQVQGINKGNLSIELIDQSGKLVQKNTLNQGSTITYLDTKTVYPGSYIVRIKSNNRIFSKNVIIAK